MLDSAESNLGNGYAPDISVSDSTVCVKYYLTEKEEMPLSTLMLKEQYYTQIMQSEISLCRCLPIIFLIHFILHCLFTAIF